MNKRRVLLFSLLLVGLVSTIALAAVGRTVYYHDAVMTQDARQINGRTYVPLADVARALGGRVASRGSDLEIATDQVGTGNADEHRTAEGGANEVRGTNGNIGDWFFNGFWRFQASRAERTDEYQYQYSPSAGSDKPSGDNDELVVVHCTMKNGQKVADNPILTPNGTSVQVTALTDDQGQSYAPINFDVRDGNLAPGASKNFAVVFSVPKGTKLKDMIFTVYSYGATDKPSNVRVNLAGQ